MKTLWQMEKLQFIPYPQYFPLFSIIKLSFIEICHRFWKTIRKTCIYFKVVCCIFVVYGKGLSYFWGVLFILSLCFCLMYIPGIVEITVGGSSGSQTLQFKNQNYSTSLHEHSGVGSRVLTVELLNPTSGVSFSFASGNEGIAYRISSEGMLLLSPQYLSSYPT